MTGDGALDLGLDTSFLAVAIAAVLYDLCIARMQAFVGASYGAMVGLLFAARLGDGVDTMVAISGAH